MRIALISDPMSFRRFDDSCCRFGHADSVHTENGNSVLGALLSATYFGNTICPTSRSEDE